MKKWLILLAWAVTTCAWAQEPPPRGPAPDWVQPLTLESDAPPAGAEAFRFELMENQVRIDEDGTHLYTRQRLRVLSAQALSALGSVAVPWDPASQSLTIHAVNLLRDDRTIDVLESQQFTVLRREGALEAARLDGIMTAVMAVDDLRVGDVLEIAHTTTTRQPLLAGHSEFFQAAAPMVPVRRMYMRADWPADRTMRLSATPDWSAPEPARRGDRFEIEIDMRDVVPADIPASAPLRFHHVRQVQGSDYASWGEVAAIFEPLYRTAATLEPDSPLRAEAARIQAAHANPAARAMAALRLVQDEVRYLALVMGEGGLTPMSADEAWRRRLGDCKAKTAMLLALLDQMGIAARPVLVSTMDDALDRRLPTVMLFNHVLVEATVDGRSLWLDGTRTGDRHADDVATPAFGWGLPIYGDGELVRMDAPPLTRPRRVTTVQIDASDGLYAPARVTAEQRQWSSAAAEMQALFTVASPAQRDTFMRDFWPRLIDDIEVESVAYEYDAEQNRFSMNVTGRMTLTWSGGRWEPPLTRINWSAGEAREAGPHRDLPMTIGHPMYSRFETTVIVPDGGAGFTIGGTDADVEAAGYRHWRRVSFEDDVLQVVRETRTLRPEIDEAERAAAAGPLDRLSRNVVEVIAPRTYTPTPGDEDAWAADTPETADEMVERALLLSGQQMYDEALAMLEEALVREPDNANLIANRGIVRFWAGDLDAAAADFDYAAALDPNEVVVLNGKGMIALRRERHREAVAWLSRALERGADESYFLHLRARAHAALGDEAAAAADVRRRMELRPEEPAMALEGLMILVDAGMRDAVLGLIDDLAERFPDEPDTQAGLARALDWVGEHQRALEVVEVLMSDPANGFSQFELDQLRVLRAQLRYLAGDMAGGDADAALVRERAETHEYLFGRLCRAQAVSGIHLQQALMDCEARVEDEIVGGDKALWHGLVLLQLGREEEALEQFESAQTRFREALGEDAVHPNALYGRGLARRALGDAEAGERDMADALARSRIAHVPFRAYETPPEP